MEEVINDVRHMTVYVNWDLSFLMTVWFFNINNPKVHNKNNFASKIFPKIYIIIFKQYFAAYKIISTKELVEFLKSLAYEGQQKIYLIGFTNTASKERQYKGYV